MIPAARLGDFHVCPAPTHGGGAVLSTPPPGGLVLTNGVLQARGTDPALCAGPIDFVVTGAATVKVHGQPAARMTDKTMHGGMVVFGSGNVMIGGPTTGVTLGNVDAAKKACEAAAAGRTSGSTKQSYENCGVETTRQIINQATGQNLTEDGLLQSAIANGQADDGGAWPWSDPDPPNAGGTYPWNRADTLNGNGVPAECVPGTMGNLTQGVAEGKGVEAAVWGGSLWPNHKPGTLSHVVLVTGVEYDENGNPKNVVINDTGARSNQCGAVYPADVFEKALLGGVFGDHVITKRPIW